MKRYFYLILLLVVALLTSCSDDDKFTVSAKIDGLGHQSVTMTWYANGAVKRMESQPKDDSTVKFEGEAREATLVELSLTSTGEPLAMLIARNGENIKCQFPLTDPRQIVVKGSKSSEAYTDFIKSNAELLEKGDYNAVNARIKQYVIDNPKSVASTALLATIFDFEGSTQLADSLLNVISPDARPLNIVENFNAVMGYRAQNSYKGEVRTMTLVGAKDSLFTFIPSSASKNLIVFTGRESGYHDSVTKVLKTLSDEYPTKRLRVIEMSLNPDSAAWRNVVRRDTTAWDMTWVPGSAAATALQRLHITRTPFFIVADSLGKQLYRTRYATNAANYIRQH